MSSCFFLINIGTDNDDDIDDAILVSSWENGFVPVINHGKLQLVITASHAKESIANTPFITSYRLNYYSLFLLYKYNGGNRKNTKKPLTYFTTFFVDSGL